MNLKLFLLTVFIFLLGTSAVCAEKTVSVVTLTDFPPYCFARQNAPVLIKETILPGQDSVQLQGYSWDIVRASYQAMGYTIELHVAPWSRGFFYMKKGKVDVIFPAITTDERELVFHYSRESVDEMRLVVYMHTDSNLLYKDLSSLDGKLISTVRGWAYGKKWERADKIIKDQVSTILQGFVMLDRKRVFGVIGYESSFDYVLRQNGMLNRYQKSPMLDSVTEHVIGRKEKSVILKITDFDSGKQKIAHNGKLKRIKKRWEAYVY